MSSSHQIILNYFPGLSEEQIQQFFLLKDLYNDWNAKINVISRKDIDNLYINHVLHSLGIAKVIQFKKNTKVIDVGTGGGFPGIPLAILFPETHFHLVDSIGKKITVVNDVVNQLKLKNVVTSNTRVEVMKEKFDFVVSRAVTTLQEFVQWVGPLISKDGFNELHNGILCLKGGDVTDELSLLKRKAMIFDLKKSFSEEFFEKKKVVYISL